MIEILRSNELNPTYAATMLPALFAQSYLTLGRTDDAEKELFKAKDEVVRLVVLPWLRHAQGRPAEAEAAMKEAKVKCGEAWAFQLAESCAGMGDRDGAFEWLEIAFRLRDSGMQVLKVQRSLVPLHGDPRWEVLLRKMKLADDQLK